MTKENPTRLASGCLLIWKTISRGDETACDNVLSVGETAFVMNAATTSTRSGSEKADVDRKAGLSDEEDKDVDIGM